MVGGPVDGEEFGWAHVWPPPERLYALRGFISGMTTYVTQEQLDTAAEKVGMGYLAETLEITPYLRDRFSKLTDEQIAGNRNVVRMAEYLVEN
jgi:hypothetical protein